MMNFGVMLFCCTAVAVACQLRPPAIVMCVIRTLVNVQQSWREIKQCCGLKSLGGRKEQFFQQTTANFRRRTGDMDAQI